MTKLSRVQETSYIYIFWKVSQFHLLCYTVKKNKKNKKKPEMVNNTENVEAFTPPRVKFYHYAQILFFLNHFHSCHWNLNLNEM